MNRLVKTVFIALIATLAFILASATVPYSESFKVANAGTDPSTLLYVFLNTLWLCFTIIFIVQNSTWSGFKLFLGTTFSLFMVYSFMTQIETWFFGAAFGVLTRSDIIWIALVNTVPIIVATLLAMWMFPRKYTSKMWRDITIGGAKEFLAKLLILGLCYVIIYFTFGYFVAWQSEPLRVFYSGTGEKLGFIAKLVDNYYEQPIIYPFQFARGILFVLSVLPLVFMMKKSSRNVLIALVLVYLSTGMGLIIPNILFPDVVRWTHFIEMTGSMLYFAIVNWFVLIKI